MIMMPKNRIEEQHDSQPGASMRQYLAGFAARLGTPVPANDHIEGEVQAFLNEGLWSARCLEEFCAGEVSVTSQWPWMFCTDCGAGWFSVVFPANKLDIEAEVLRRKKARNGFLPHANWVPGESIDDLIAQRIEAEGE